jgi:hypothetical protein
MAKQFDCDSAALKKCLLSNVPDAAANLEVRIIRQVAMRAGMQFLDPGCGIGTQIQGSHRASGFPD